MPMIVDTNTVVDPWAVVILLSSASATSFAMLASQRTPDHTGDAEVVLVKLCFTYELSYNGLLLLTAG